MRGIGVSLTISSQVPMFYIFEGWLYQYYPEALEYPEEKSIPIHMEDPSTHPE